MAEGLQSGGIDQRVGMKKEEGPTAGRFPALVHLSASVFPPTSDHSGPVTSGQCQGAIGAAAVYYDDFMPGRVFLQSTECRVENWRFIERRNDDGNEKHGGAGTNGAMGKRVGKRSLFREDGDFRGRSFLNMGINLPR